MTCLVFFLEEQSAKAMLEELLPRLLPEGVVTRYVVFEGKQDLEHQLERRMRGWLVPDSIFVVLRDQDAGNCKQIKQKLVRICERTGKKNVLVRIACRELESFYLGDLDAVEEAYGMPGLARHSASAKFRNPDRLSRPSEELKKLTKNQYQKISGSRAIAARLKPGQNRSQSFLALVRGLDRVVSETLHPVTQRAAGPTER